jgi:hypothetical protein
MYTGRRGSPLRPVMMVAEPPDVNPPPDSHIAANPRLVVSMLIVFIFFFFLVCARGVEFGFWPLRGRELPQHRGELPLNMSSALNTNNFDTQCTTHKRQQQRNFPLNLAYQRTIFANLRGTSPPQIM